VLRTPWTSLRDLTLNLIDSWWERREEWGRRGMRSEPDRLLNAFLCLYSFSPMDTLSFDVRSLRDLQGLRYETVGTVSWDIRVIAVARIDEALCMV
jgi:hypothetical protein